MEKIDNADMSVGQRIKEARKEAGLTQAELCAKVGMNQSTLSELERGDSRSTSFVASLAAALRVSPLWLETGRGPKHSTPGDQPQSPSDLDDALALLHAYRALPPEGRSSLTNHAKALVAAFGAAARYTSNNQS